MSQTARVEEGSIDDGHVDHDSPLPLSMEGETTIRRIQPFLGIFDHRVILF